MQSLQEKVAIITGASSGIGAATARELAGHGSRVVLAARRRAELEAEAHCITKSGGLAIAVPTDVTDLAQVMRLVEHTIDSFGRIDILVNNAGINWVRPLAETSAEEMIRLVQVNLLGAMLATRLVLPHMQERRDGAIISVGSVASRVAIEPLYSATKFGIRGFSLALRRQLAGSGISVSLVTPGNIQTRMTSGLQERMPGPETVARRIARLAVEPRREVVFPLKYRAILALDSMVPAMADAIFNRRHSRDAGSGPDFYMPAYARANGNVFASPATCNAMEKLVEGGDRT